MDKEKKLGGRYVTVLVGGQGSTPHTRQICEENAAARCVAQEKVLTESNLISMGGI